MESWLVNEMYKISDDMNLSTSEDRKYLFTQAVKCPKVFIYAAWLNIEPDFNREEENGK